MTTHFFTDTGVLTARSLRHVLRSPDTIITTAIQPIGFMLLFVYVLGGAIDTGPGSGPYVSYLLPGILVITIAAGIAYKPSPHIYAPLARRHGNACTTGSSRD
ncbi:ABC-2 type transport system permease protein [Brevibacterium sandarakinum]|uniref:ABC-2 type transport system permease protein n=1 Tax=Brevibacterium sandarakinum TaxID=629680 RepID=A0A1H1X8F6_BRESA|nr:ABC-2 type transport system permease protein [Brevibacterium sandarakinum]